MSTRRTAAALVVAAGAVAIAGCDHQYVYAPTVATTSAVAGRPASFYAIPPEAPRGSVQLATFGFADLHPTGEGSDLRAIHMRMIVSNNADTAWRIDTREQVLALPDHGQSRPAFASSDAGAGPVLEVPPNGKVTVDLFYPLPEQMQDANDVPAFATLWKVDTGTRIVSDRTPFERLEVVDRYAYDDYDYDYGWGPYGYYYDPYYVHGGAFVGVRIGPSFAHRPVIVRPHGGFHGGFHGGGFRGGGFHGGGVHGGGGGFRGGGGHGGGGHGGHR